ncbi:MAG: ribonuclease Y [Lentisphaeria bacterium]
MEYLAIGIAVIVLILASIIYKKSVKNSAALEKAEQDARKIAEAASREAEGMIKEAKDMMREARAVAKEEKQRSVQEFEQFSREKRNELSKMEKRLLERERNLERKSDSIEDRAVELGRREDNLRKLTTEVENKSKEIDELVIDQKNKLIELSGLSQDEARKIILTRVENELSIEKNNMIRRHMEEVKKSCDRQAQSAIVSAIQRYAGDCTYERTSAIISLPNDEMKGRIIGREGRNIRVIEAATGANILVDDTPDAVVVSCFDPVRKEIARVTMERLIEDGRIHPTRIEETINKVKKDIDVEILKAGEEAVDSLGIVGVSNHLLRLLGRLKFRYSFSQNVLQHSIEVARMMAMIAAELGLNIDNAKRMGLFHDIGKAVDHEVEGSHALIGADILKRAGESAEVINGVASHHEDVAAESPLAVLVCACDTISAGRPGARSETTEIYLKRLHQLEEIGMSFTGVSECFAIQGGRELRIIVNANDVAENESYNLAREIVGRIETEMKYPGQIKVTILRETRAVEYAK